jgi:hypothetical protein
MDDNLFLEEKVVRIYIFSFLDRRSSSSFFFSLPIAPFIPRGKSEFLTNKYFFVLGFFSGCSADISSVLSINVVLFVPFLFLFFF